MKSIRLSLVALACLSVYGWANSEAYTLPSISVTSDEAHALVEEEQDAANSVAVSKESIDKRVGPGATNPYKALDMLASVHTGQVDSYGLSLDQNSFRIRGLYADTFSRLALTADGVPSVVNVGQGAMGSILDMENIEAMNLTMGASKADSGFGFGNNAGSLDMRTKKASDTLGVMLKQSVGTEDFYRTFMRVDSGKISENTKLFLSASTSQADKWKGSGDTQRENVEAGLSTLLFDTVKTDILLAHNDIERNDYRALTYAQAKNLGTYYNYDFNPTLTSSAANNKYYYDFNRQHFKENLAQATFEAPLFEGTMSFKPYHIDTDGYRYAYNQSGNSVTKTEMEQEQNGFIAQYAQKIADADVKVGYWYQSIESIPPPTANKSYNIVNGKLVFSSWSMLNDVGNREIDSPFLSVKKEFDQLEVEAGIRYMRMTLGGVQSYTTTSGDVSDGEAIAHGTRISYLYADDTTLSATLPSLNFKYTLSDSIDLFAGYAKGYASPWIGPLFSIYKSNNATFRAKGISLQDIWDKFELETSDQFDVGAKIKGENWMIVPTLYHVVYNDKQVTAYDPAVNLTYYQNNAKAEANGFELSATYELSRSFELFSAFSYNQLKFTDNLTTTGGATLAISGNQVPDAPKILAKVGTTYKQNGFYVSPALKYVDKRYGDIQNIESIPSYYTVDVETGYVTKNFYGFKEALFSVSLQNLLDKKYIAIIKNDLDDTGTGGTSYYTGAPFTAVASITLKF
ncbi:TonB-dependent receptor [Sulfurospirillum cavolei]|uniref:TonB-dependent receptor n=1 Tax=Sulfurospirillum cavolei TaxID=366522 RepID=UPI0005AABCEC|nr:TonB-dependent receptor [Sulfurospirillum cavolei]